MKKITSFLLMTFVAFSLVGCGGSKATNTTQQSKEDTKQESTNKPEEQPKQQDTQKVDGLIKQGTYKVGTDIQAGEYLVISKGRGYYKCSKDSTGETGSIIFNENLTDGSNSYVTLKDGDYFKVTNAEMYPIDKAPSIIPKDGVYKDGMYKVGQDIPGGEYKIKLVGARGYYAVYKDSRYAVGDIISNENVTADTYLTVKDGEYLRMTGLQIQKN